MDDCDDCDDDGAFADGGGNPFDGPGADVADREDAGQTGLQTGRWRTVSTRPVVGCRCSYSSAPPPLRGTDQHCPWPAPY